MVAIHGVLICLTYILGLLLTGLPGDILGIPIGAIALLLSGIAAFYLTPRHWRIWIHKYTWLIAGGVGFLASLYFQWRLPQPTANDLSLLLGQAFADAPVEVQGQVATSPHVTRSHKIQFVLQVTGVRPAAEPKATGANFQTASGQVYVTLPETEGRLRYPSEQVTVTGQLYAAKPAANPGGFDFQAYLKQQGIFVGLHGKRILPQGQSLTLMSQLQWHLWHLRERIVDAQVAVLGNSNGAFLGAMVLGKNAVDVPYDLRDQFTLAGLAHALAASGFQVSLLAGIVVALTKRLPPALRLVLGISVITAYVGLTGLQPAVLRAAIMGFAVLYGLALERKTRPLNALLLAATLLLLYNPIWIWDLGFQFSFLATLGLMVTVPVLDRWLDGLPVFLSSAITVPLAAYLWTLPLQLYVFGTLSPYSILINMLAAPLITVISLGGMASAIATLIYEPLGGALAWLLALPIDGLIHLVRVSVKLPGTSIAVGKILVWQVLTLYTLFGLVWWQPRCQRYWWIVGLTGLSLTLVPLWHTSTHMVQATILTTKREPMMVVQNRGNVGVIGIGEAAEVQFGLLPFLRQQGVNRVDWAIAPNLSQSSAVWQTFVQTLPIQQLFGEDTSNTLIQQARNFPTQKALLDTLQQQQGHYSSLPLKQTVTDGIPNVKLINAHPAVMQFQLGEQQWILLHHFTPDVQPSVLVQSFSPADVLWWTGEELAPEVLTQIQPQVAIASTTALPEKTAAWLQHHHVTVFTTQRDGAIQWTPEGFTPLLNAEV